MGIHLSVLVGDLCSGHPVTAHVRHETRGAPEARGVLRFPSRRSSAWLLAEVSAGEALRS